MRIGCRILLAVALAVALAAFRAEAQTSFSGVWTYRPLASTPAGEPGARGWVDLIDDWVAGRPVLFGGSGGHYFNDILQMDLAGGRWIEIEPYTPNVTPDGPPCPRDEHAVAFDSFNRLYWSFGGSGFACGAYTSVVGSGSGGTQLIDPSLPATTVDFYKDWLVAVVSNTTFYSYVSGYDPTSKTLTLSTAFPGNPAGLTYSVRPQGGGGTWFYNPATRQWRGFEAPSYGYAGARPAGRLSPAFAFSTRDAAAVMFGGSTYNDTWVLDVTTRTWVPMRGDGWPGNPPRRAQVTNSMVYDSVNDVFVLFGGRCSDPSGFCGSVPYNGVLGDTWIYRLATNTWTQMAPGTSPPARDQHTLSYDPVAGVVVLFGGRTYSGVLNDVWAYDVSSNTWTPVSTGTRPAARKLHAMVYHPTTGEHIIYGGDDANLASMWDVWSLRLTRSGSVPVLSSLSSTSALQGGPAFTLTVTGANFVSASVVQWNGSPRTTTFVSATKLTASIPASDLSAAGFASVKVFNPGPGGGTSNALTFTITPPATLSLVYNGLLRDRVGQGDTALGPDGALDGTVTVTLKAAGGKTVTALRLDSTAPGTWDTTGGNIFFVLGVATSVTGALLNAPGTMAVNFPVADGGTFVVFASDYQGKEFLPGRTLTLTATFSDGTTATASTTIAASALTLAYNGLLRDRVGQGDTALGPDGALDGTVTVTLKAAGGKTVTALRLDSTAPGTWDTTGGNIFFVLGVATSVTGALLNAPGTMAVNFPVADGGTFVVFASDYQNMEFVSGRTLTLTATFSDGSTAVASTVAP